MLYAIYAYENIYGGLHGMCDHAVVDCKNEKEANEIGFNMSLEVIDSYQCICDDLREEASDEYEDYTNEWYDYLNEIKSENTAWEIYPILDARGKSVNELENEFWNNTEEFIETYCRCS